MDVQDIPLELLDELNVAVHAGDYALSPRFAVPPAVDAVRISTITSTFKLNQQVDLYKMALLCWNVFYDPKSTALVNAKGVPRKSFNNQATIELTLSRHRVTASVFSNGVVRLTGCRSREECEEAADNLLVQLSRRDHLGMAGEEICAVNIPELLTWAELTLCTVKADCDLQFGSDLDLVEVCRVARASYPKTSYDPSNYCAVKVVVPLEDIGKDVTVCIFKSGKCFVSASIPLEAVAPVYHAVRSVLASNLEEILPEAERKKRKWGDDVDLLADITFDDLMDLDQGTSEGTLADEAPAVKRARAAFPAPPIFHEIPISFSPVNAPPSACA